jgi:hypothetical protein
MSISSVGNQSSIQSLLLNDLKKNGLTSDVASQVESEIASVFQSQATSGTRPSPTDVRAAIEAKLAEDVSSGSLTQEQADAVIKALDEFESQIKQSGGAGGGKGGPDPSELFSKLDSDGDGTLTEEEFLAGRPDGVSEDQAKQLYAKIAEESGGNAGSGLTQEQFTVGFAAAAPSGPPPGGGAPPAGGGGGGSSDSGSSDEVVSVTTTTSADGTKTTVTKYADGSSSTSVTYGQADSSSADTLQAILKSLTKGNSDSGETSAYLNKRLAGNLIATVA